MHFVIPSAILAFLGAALYRRDAAEARRAEQKSEPHGQFVEVETCRLHYVRQGTPGRPAVVFLHGSDGFLQDFTGVMQAGLAGEFDMIAFDRSGHGLSGTPTLQGLTLPFQAHLIRAALRELGIVRPILVGHSWSAVLCLSYALDYPEETAGLVLLAPWVYPNADPPSPLIRSARLIGGRLSYLLLAFTPLKRLLLRRGLAQAFYPDGVPCDYENRALSLWLLSPDRIAAFVQENVDAWKRLPALSARYPEVAAPVIVLVGDNDRIVHAQQHAHPLHEALPHSELHVLEETGHEIPQFQPLLVADAVRRLREIAADSHGTAVRLPATDVSGNTEGALRRRARELVFRHGWNATAYQILNPDILHWFMPDGEAVVGYVRHFKTRVAAGAPVCEESRLEEVVRQFEQTAANCGEAVCWFASTVRLQNALGEPPHAQLPIGAQPVWNPAHWADILKQNSSLRSQLNRARNKGVTVAEWSLDRAAGNPDLQRCLDDWLVHHALPTLRFLTEPVTLDRLTDRRVFVAEANGVPIGFLIATPVPSRNGWLVEQIARRHAAPNGTAELLVDGAMRELAADGVEYITLGLVPLTRCGRAASSPRRLWLRVTLTWIRLHGRRFYNFEGLDAFKAKFKPETWEPLLALSNEPRISPRTLMAITAAFSDGPLFWTAARALAAAARREIRWLAEKTKENTASK